MTISLTKYQTITYEIDKIPALTGIGIILNTNQGSSTIRENNSCLAAGDYLVIDLDAEVASQYDWGNIGQEAGLAAINCSAAVIAALVTFGSTAATPVTGGTSLALTSIGYAATVATGASCAVSAVRTYNAITDPKTNEIYDSIPAYQTTMKVLDGVSLLGVGASAIAMTKVMKIMGRAGITLGAAKAGSASRPARTRLAREVLKYENPAMTNRQVKEYFKLGMGPKRVTTKALTENTILSLRDSLAAGLSFLSSSLDGHVKNAAIYIVRLGD